jgi:hypothetical protein
MATPAETGPQSITTGSIPDVAVRPDQQSPEIKHK